VWIPDGRSIKPVSITIGLNDGNFVEMLDGPLHDGDSVVIDEIKTGSKTTGNTSPFASGPRMR
jgi:multidrug efflux pump subunit AcrA (membrane-fusion protein)